MGARAQPGPRGQVRRRGEAGHSVEDTRTFLAAEGPRRRCPRRAG
jgi:hypothetical protein